MAGRLRRHPAIGRDEQHGHGSCAATLWSARRRLGGQSRCGLGFRAKVEAEIALARGEFLLNAVEAHGHTLMTGPAADEAARRLEEFGDHAAFTGTVMT